MPAAPRSGGPGRQNRPKAVDDEYRFAWKAALSSERSARNRCGSWPDAGVDQPSTPRISAISGLVDAAFVLRGGGRFDALYLQRTDGRVKER